MAVFDLIPILLAIFFAPVLFLCGKSKEQKEEEEWKEKETQLEKNLAEQKEKHNNERYTNEKEIKNLKKRLENAESQKIYDKKAIEEYKQYVAENTPKIPEAQKKIQEIYEGEDFERCSGCPFIEKINDYIAEVRLIVQKKHADYNYISWLKDEQMATEICWTVIEDVRSTHKCFTEWNVEKFEKVMKDHKSANEARLGLLKRLSESEKVEEYKLSDSAVEALIEARHEFCDLLKEHKSFPEPPKIAVAEQTQAMTTMAE